MVVTSIGLSLKLLCSYFALLSTFVMATFSYYKSLSLQGTAQYWFIYFALQP